MTAKEWLNTIQQAADYNHAMTPLIVKYGEMLVEEYIRQIEFTTYCDKCNRIMAKKQVISLICMNPECENYIKKQNK